MTGLVNYGKYYTRIYSDQRRSLARHQASAVMTKSELSLASTNSEKYEASPVLSDHHNKWSPSHGVYGHLMDNRLMGVAHRRRE